jgi:L-lactate dehydrogenase
MKVGIVGMGWVGSSVAISTLQSGVASELLVCDLKGELAEGEAMDLAHGALFYPAVKVRAVELSELATADAVVIAAGRGGSPEESRLNLLRGNAAIVRDVASSLKGLQGLLLVVTNPVDLLTQVALEASGLPPARVLGTGTMLDTARLRQVIGREIKVDAHSIHAHVVGEHGDSEVVLWSNAQAGGIPLHEWPGFNRTREAAIAEEVRCAAYEIIRRKGATNHAIGLVTASILRSYLRGEQRIVTLSRVQEGAFGLRDVALSLPCVVSGSGVTQVLEPTMTEGERTAFLRSADVLRQARASLDS